MISLEKLLIDWILSCIEY